MCLVPFLQSYHSSPIRAFYDEWVAFALGVAAIGLVSCGRKAALARAPALSVWLGLFALSLIARAVAGEGAYPQSALLWALYALFAATIVVLGQELTVAFGRERVCDGIAAFLLAGALANSMAAVLQIAGIPHSLDFLISKLHSNRATGIIGQSNLLANYLALGQASLLYLCARGKMGIWASVPAGVLLVVGASLAVSRSSVLYAAAFASLAYFSTFRDKSSTARKLSKDAFVMGAGVVLAQWLVPIAVNTYGVDLEGGFLRNAAADSDAMFSDRATRLRLIAWDVAARLFMSSPWLGVGPDEFAGAAFRQGRLPLALTNDQVWTSPHNLVLQLLAETGLIGTVLVLSGLTAWLWRAISAFAKEFGPAIWWILACASVGLLHAMLEYPMWYAHYLALTALVMGIGARGGISIRPLVMKGTLAVAGLLGAILLSIHLVAYIRFDLASPVSAGRSLGSDREVFEDRRTLAAMGKSLLAPRSELWLFVGYPLDETNLAEKVAVGQRVVRLWPSRQVVVRQSILLAMAGRQAEAASLFTQGLATFSNRTASIRADLAAAPVKAREVLEPLLRGRPAN